MTLPFIILSVFNPSAIRFSCSWVLHMGFSSMYNSSSLGHFVLSICILSLSALFTSSSFHPILLPNRPKCFRFDISGQSMRSSTRLEANDILNYNQELYYSIVLDIPCKDFIELALFAFNSIPILLYHSYSSN